MLLRANVQTAPFWTRSLTTAVGKSPIVAVVLIKGDPMERTQLLVSGLLIGVVVSLTSSAPAACPQHGKFQAVDLAVPVDQGFITKMHELGIGTVIRYYDHKNETASGKQLTRKERDLISANGLNLMVVFQHQSSKIETFTPARGRQDASVPFLSRRSRADEDRAVRA